MTQSDIQWNVRKFMSELVFQKPFFFSFQVRYRHDFSTASSPICHHAYSSWIEKTMMETGNCPWADYFVLQ